jgi:hypothetical protein
MPDGELGEMHARLRAELDSVAQNLYGIVAALDGHRRRAHKPGTRSFEEMDWAALQLLALHGRIVSAGELVAPRRQPG